MSRRTLGRLAGTASFAISLLAAACSGGPSGGGGAGGAPCGAPAGDWQYLSSCDSKIGGLIHQCQDTYANPAAAAAVNQELPALCTAFGGTLLSSPCSAANNVGSCVISASSGSLQGELERVYYYPDNGVTTATVQSSCNSAGSTFIRPNGTLPDGGAPANSGACGVAAPAMSSGSSPSGVAFSLATRLNGQVIECTNYVGTVTPQQLQSVIAIGATTTDCPDQNAGCACTEAAGSGTFGTTPTLVYYKTTTDPTAAICSNMGASCSSTYTPP